jgi:hypothetical protein
MNNSPTYIAKAKVNYHVKHAITWEWMCLTRTPSGNSVWSTTSNKDRVEPSTYTDLLAAAKYLSMYSWFMDYNIRQIVRL